MKQILLCSLTAILGSVAALYAGEPSPHLARAGQSAGPPPGARGGPPGGFDNHEVSSFFTFHPSADVEGGAGSVSVRRGGAGYSYRDMLFRGAIVRLGVEYEFSRYTFEDMAPLFDGEEDLDLSSHRASAAYIRPMRGSPWSIFSIVFLDAGMEQGAGYDDALSPGGILATGYEMNDDLSILLGLFVGLDLQNDLRVYPLIGADWRITDRLTLGLLPTRQSRELEVMRILSLDYKPRPERPTAYSLVLGFGGQEFRLDEGRGDLSEGLLDETGVALVGSVQHTFRNKLTVAAFAGAYVYRELELLDRNDRTLREDDYDPSPVLGASLSLPF